MKSMEFLKSFRSKALLQTGLILAGIAALALGIYRGEVQTVLMKAIYICLECIGIG